MEIPSYVSKAAVSTNGEMNSDTPTDSELLASFLAGDADAMGVLYDRHARAVMVYLLGMLGDRQEARDVLQHVMVGFIRRGASLRNGTSVRSYLLASAHNRVMNLRRSRTREQASLRGYEALVRRRSSQPGPAKQAEAEEQRRRLNAALAGLPDDEREVVLLHVYGGLSFTEAAQALETPRSTVASRYQAAIAKLREFIGHE